MDRNTRSVRGTSKAMTWYGSLTIWIRYVVALPSSTLRLSQRRLSIALIPPVPLIASAYVNSEAFAVLGRYSQHRTRCHLTFSILVPSRSPREVMATCTRELSMVQEFALDVCGFIIQIVWIELPKCVIDTITFPVFRTNETHRPSAKKPLCGNA